MAEGIQKNMKPNPHTICVISLLLVTSLIGSSSYAAEIAIKDGATVAFVGDSITAQGNSLTEGFVHIVTNALAVNGVKVNALVAAHGGYTSADVLKLLLPGVLKQKPDWMTLCCGINDTAKGPRNVPLEQFKTNITSIVSQAQAAGVQVVIITTAILGGNPSLPGNEELQGYNDFLRSFAVQNRCRLTDWNSKEQQLLKEMQAKPPRERGRLTSDNAGHLNGLGNRLLALEILKTLGLTEEQLPKPPSS